MGSSRGRSNMELSRISPLHNGQTTAEAPDALPMIATDNDPEPERLAGSTGCTSRGVREPDGPGGSKRDRGSCPENRHSAGSAAKERGLRQSRLFDGARARENRFTAAAAPPISFSRKFPRQGPGQSGGCASAISQTPRLLRRRRRVQGGPRHAVERKERRAGASDEDRGANPVQEGQIQPIG